MVSQSPTTESAALREQSNYSDHLGDLFSTFHDQQTLKGILSIGPVRGPFVIEQTPTNFKFTVHDRGSNTVSEIWFDPEGYRTVSQDNGQSPSALKDHQLKTILSHYALPAIAEAQHHIRSSETTQKAFQAIEDRRGRGELKVHTELNDGPLDLTLQFVTDGWIIKILSHRGACQSEIRVHQDGRLGHSSDNESSPSRFADKITLLAVVFGEAAGILT